MFLRGFLFFQKSDKILYEAFLTCNLGERTFLASGLFSGCRLQDERFQVDPCSTKFYAFYMINRPLRFRDLKFLMVPSLGEPY